MPLDSDISNADAQLTVEFYEYAQAPYIGVPFVKIMAPGDANNIVDQPAREDHKRRFPNQWIAFQMRGSDVSAIGTGLEVWRAEDPEGLSQPQMSELHILGFRTAEQLASASDAQIQRVGMGGAGLRERARRYVAAKARAAQSGEIDELKAQLAELRAMLGDKKGLVRPKKVTDGDDDAGAGNPGYQ